MASFTATGISFNLGFKNQYPTLYYYYRLQQLMLTIAIAQAQIGILWFPRTDHHTLRTSEQAYSQIKYYYTIGYTKN